jgi:hypothetical protein
MKKVLLTTSILCLTTFASFAQQKKLTPKELNHIHNYYNCKIIVTGEVTNVPCFGDSSGGIDIIVSHTKGNVTYLWSDGSTEQNREGIAAANYSVTVKDETGRKTTASFTVVQPATPLVVTAKIKPPTSPGECDGATLLRASGGNPLYSITWNDGSTSSCRNDLCPGNYKVCVTDSNGCTVTTKIKIPNATAFSSSVSADALVSKDKTNAMASPNPTKGFVQLSFAAKASGSASLNVYNMGGKKMTTEKFAVSAGTNNKQINLSNFGKGLYNVEILVDGEKKVVKVLLQ